MNVIGIVAEYNPFHNGHLYHINKIKKMYPDSVIIAVISGSFCQRGDISILNKWDKSLIAINNQIDLVIELPFVFATQSADIFAKGAIKLLNSLHVDTIVFGSESNDIDYLTKIANQQINDKDYHHRVKSLLNKGINYPTAMAKALNMEIKQPNDLLAISYIKEIIKNNYSIKPIAIKRTNDYHDDQLNNSIVSATAIRSNLDDSDILNYLPNSSYEKLYRIDMDRYFQLLKYKIISDINILNTYQTVDEGIENRIKSTINNSNNLEELIMNIKTKRYTYNKINRMLTHILCSFTKEETANIEIEYIKILGFNKKGRNYLNTIKKDIAIPLITSYRFASKILDIEYRVTNIYSLLVNDDKLIKREKEKPIIK